MVPGQVIALLWLPVARLNLPLASGKKERDAFFTVEPMHDVKQRQIMQSENETRFFARISHHCCTSRFRAIDMAGNDTVLTVLVARVGP